MKAQTDISSLTLQQAWDNAINALLDFEKNPANYFYRAYQLRDCVAKAWLEVPKNKAKGLTSLAADDQEKILKSIKINPEHLEALKKSNILYDMEITLDVLQQFCKEDVDFGINPFYGTFFHTRIVRRIGEEDFPQQTLNLVPTIKHREYAEALKQCFELAQICKDEGVPEKDFPRYFEAYLGLISNGANQSLFETKGLTYQIAYLNILCNESSNQLYKKQKELNQYYQEGVEKATRDPKRFAAYYATARMMCDDPHMAKVYPQMYARMRVEGYSEILSTQPRIQKSFAKLSKETLRKCDDVTKKMWARGFNLDFTDAYVAKLIIQKRSKEFATAYAIYRTQHGYGPYRSNIHAFFAWLGFKLKLKPAPTVKPGSHDESIPHSNFPFTPKKLFEVVHGKVMIDNPEFSRKYSQQKSGTWLQKHFSFFFKSGPEFTEAEREKSERLLKSLN